MGGRNNLPLLRDGSTSRLFVIAARQTPDASRHISIEMIERTLRTADQRHPDRDDAELVHALKRFHFQNTSAILRVVYNATVTPWYVVTMFFDRRLSRRT